MRVFSNTLIFADILLILKGTAVIGKQKFKLFSRLLKKLKKNKQNQCIKIPLQDKNTNKNLRAINITLCN